MLPVINNRNRIQRIGFLNCPRGHLIQVIFGDFLNVIRNAKRPVHVADFLNKGSSAFTVRACRNMSKSGEICERPFHFFSVILENDGQKDRVGEPVRNMIQAADGVSRRVYVPHTGGGESQSGPGDGEEAPGLG